MQSFKEVIHKASLFMSLKRGGGGGWGVEAYKTSPSVSLYHIYFLQPAKQFRPPALHTYEPSTSSSSSISLTALMRPFVIPLRCNPFSFISSSSFSAVSQSKAFRKRDWINLLYSSTLG
ncbi:hypothetical protein ACB092_04G059700 [Castanea dentata]